MGNDDLEAIDLTSEAGNGPVGRKAPRRARRWIATVGVAATVLALGATVLIRGGSRHPHGSTVPTDSSPSPSSSTDSTLTVRETLPSGVAGLEQGRYVAVVNGTPILVDGPHSARTLPGYEAGYVFVDASSHDTVLIGGENRARVIVGPRFDGTRFALPSAIALMPDALGRWWSNFGQLNVGGELHALTFPAGTTPVAKLRDGYLLVNNEHTVLLEWRAAAPLLRIGTGRARVLAVANERVAWSDDIGSVVHLTNLTTGHTSDVRSGGYAITARFSPDTSRLAILISASLELMVLADITSGRVITTEMTSKRDSGLDALENVPAAFEPAPFSWASDGRLTLVLTTAIGERYVLSVDPTDGSVSPGRLGPDGLQQLIPLVP